MKQTLRDYLVFCDMDNTLLTAKEGIPSCNRTVIKLFTQLGGRFTVATGRPPESIRAALGDIQLSLPAISCNGSLLYDFSTDTVLRRATLDRKQATLAIQDVVRQFPRIGVEVMAHAGEMFVVQANEYTHAHQVDEKITRRLEALGVNEGTPVDVLNKKGAGSVIIKVRGTRLALGKRLSSGITVEEARS